MTIAISFALAFFLCAFLVPIAIRYAPALGLVDQPDGERKVHSLPIPRVGGIAMAVAFFVPVTIWLHDVSALFGLLIGAVIIVIFGLLDDRHDLSYKWKFFGQFIAVAVFLAGNVTINNPPFFGVVDIPVWLIYSLLVLFILGVTNAVNLSDGLDGLAAGSSLLSLGFMAILAYSAAEYSYAIIAVSAMGALTGFLRFNTHPATVFMGDTGSQFLGYMAACLVIMVTQSPALPVSPVLALLVVGLPVLDTLMVMVLRIKTGHSPFHPDQRHIHHQLLKAGLVHYQAVGVIYLLKFLLLVLAYIFRYENDFVVLSVYVLFCAATLSAISVLRLFVGGAKKLECKSEQIERRNHWLRRFSWLHDHGAHFVQYILGGIWVVFLACGEHSFRKLDLVVLAVFPALFMYRRYFHFDNKMLARIIFYSLSVLAVHVLTYESYLDLPGWRALHCLDFLLMALMVMLALAIKTTRREVFRMDTQDILVLLILLAAPLLTLGVVNDKLIVGAVLRLSLLLYASEYIISRIAKPVAASYFAAAGAIVYLLAAVV